MSPRKLFTQEQEQFVRDNIKGTLIMDLAEQINNRFDLSITPAQLRNYAKRNKLTSGVRWHAIQRRLFTPEQEQFIRDNIKGTLTKDLAKRINDRFGLSITGAQIRNYIKNHNLTSGVCCQYSKGHTPANKGKKMLPEVYEIAKKTMFKKGQTPINHRPVGSERVNVYGYVEVKVAEPNKWRLKHQVIYEEANGKIPKGHCLIFLDGDKTNVTLDNLILISRQELVRLNQDNLIFQNKEMTKAGINITKIKMAYLKRQKEANA